MPRAINATDLVPLTLRDVKIASYETLRLPESINDHRGDIAYQFNNPNAQLASANEPVHWQSPYGSQSCDEAASFCDRCYDCLPTGIVPWGERTPDGLRHIGLGDPNAGTSWRNRPFAASFIAGPIWSTPLISGHIHQDAGFLGGARFTWDYDHYWGLETRFAAADLGISDQTRKTVARDADFYLGDVSLMYYPWGDSRWRPFFTVGLGAQSFNLYDDRGIHYNELVFGLPFGIGLKYMLDPWTIVRAEMMDNFSAGGGGLNAVNTLSLTAGLEIRFGGPRPSYWPWNPNRKIW